MPARSRPMQQRWPRRCQRHAYWVTSTSSRPDWRTCWHVSTLSSSQITLDATSVVPRRPRARRHWLTRPKIWPPYSTHWKVAGNRLRTILEEWKTISGLDRKVNDALWKRYSAARETFKRRRGSHFSEFDWERTGIKQSKERLC